MSLIKIDQLEENFVKVTSDLFNGITLSVITTDDSTYFVGNEIARLLGYKDAPGAIKKHVDPLYKTTLSSAHPIVWSNQLDAYLQAKSILLSEPGVYELIFSSKLPLARKFHHYVVGELLPTMRRRVTDRLLKEKDNLIAEKERAITRLQAEHELEMTATTEKLQLSTLPNASVANTLLFLVYKIDNFCAKEFEGVPHSGLYFMRAQQGNLKQLILSQKRRGVVLNLPPMYAGVSNSPMKAGHWLRRLTESGNWRSTAILSIGYNNSPNIVVVRTQFIDAYVEAARALIKHETTTGKNDKILNLLKAPGYKLITDYMPRI